MKAKSKPIRDYLDELDKICKLPVTAKVLSLVNYKDHLECHNYYGQGKTSKQKAVEERHYFFTYRIIEGECIIYQTQAMTSEEPWITKVGKKTSVAVRRAVKEFYKRYNK